MNWNRVELFDADAAKVPAMLARLGGSDAKQARNALSFFSTALVHQDSLAPGAAVVAPLLAEVACAKTCTVRGSVFVLLGTMAADGAPLTMLRASKVFRPVKAIAEATKACAAEAVSRLEDKDASVRSGAAFLLAYLQTKSAVPALEARLSRETNAIARGSLLVTLSLLAPSAHKRFTEALRSKDAVVRLGGLLGAAHEAPLSAQAKQVALALLDQKPVSGFPWKMGDVSGLAFDVLQRAAVRDGDASALITLLETRGRRVVDPLLDLLLPKRVAVAKLNEAQRQFLDALSADEALYGSFNERLVKLGLPASAKDARRQLGFAVSEPLDEVIVIDGKSRTFEAHVREAVKRPAFRAPLAKALVRGRTAEQVIECCTQVMRADVKGKDADGSLSDTRVVHAILSAFTGPELLPLIRTHPLHPEVQLRSGDTVYVDLNPAFALVLAKRTTSGDEKRFASFTASEFDTRWLVPIWKELLLLLDLKRRSTLLDKALFDWMTDGFTLDGAYLPVLLETPSPKLASSLVTMLTRWKKDYEGARRTDSRRFTIEGLNAKQLKTMSPKDHPVVKPFIEPLRQYVTVLRDAKLVKEADKLGALFEGFLSM